MKYLPTLIAAGTALAGMFATPLQGLVSAHPTLSLVLASLYAILAHLLPSPVEATK